MNRRFLLAAAAAFFLAAPCANSVAQSLVVFDRSKLVIESGGTAHNFNIEIARTNEQLQQGLMFRDKMAADAGMIFFYHPPQPVSMWMKNTILPLDMLFIAADGKIVNIRERAVPGSLDNISSDGPVRAVLELNGGTVSRLKFKPGDIVRHPELAR